MQLRRLALIGATALTIILAGCGNYGESHSHNAPPPKGDVYAQWERIQSPGNYHTIIWTCMGKDGIYIDQADNNSVTVTTNDPNCGPNGQLLIPVGAHEGT